MDSQRLFSGERWFSVFSPLIAETRYTSPWLLLTEQGSRVVLALPVMEIVRKGSKLLASQSNYYTPYFDLICHSETASAMVGQLFPLAQWYLKNFDAIEFSPLTAESRSAIAQQLKSLGFSVETNVCTRNWRTTRIKDFDSYWSQRPSQLRNTARRKWRKLSSMGNFEFTVASNEDLEPSISDYAAVYARSWKSEENHPGFIPDLIRTMGRSGHLRLGLVYLQGQPVAAQVWLVQGGEAYIYKLAYDQRFAEWSLGTLLTSFMAETVISNDDVHTLDFLTGDDSYKAQWMDECRDLYSVRAYNPRRPRGLVSIAAHKARSLRSRRS